MNFYRRTSCLFDPFCKRTLTLTCFAFSLRYRRLIGLPSSLPTGNAHVNKVFVDSRTDYSAALWICLSVVHYSNGKTSSTGSSRFLHSSSSGCRSFTVSGGYTRTLTQRHRSNSSRSFLPYNTTLYENEYSVHLPGSERTRNGSKRSTLGTRTSLRGTSLAGLFEVAFQTLGSGYRRATSS